MGHAHFVLLSVGMWGATLILSKVCSFHSILYVNVTRSVRNLSAIAFIEFQTFFIQVAKGLKFQPNTFKAFLWSVDNRKLDLFSEYTRKINLNNRYLQIQSSTKTKFAWQILLMQKQWTAPIWTEFKNLNKINVITIPHVLHISMFSVHYLEQNACV